jgi:hypothetical protein
MLAKKSIGSFQKYLYIYMHIYILYIYISAQPEAAQPIAALQKIPLEQAAPASTEKDAKDARPSASSACRAARGTRGAEAVAPPVKSSDPRSNGTRATRTHQRRAMGVLDGFVLLVFGGAVVVIGY